MNTGLTGIIIVTAALAGSTSFATYKPQKRFKRCSAIQCSKFTLGQMCLKRGTVKVCTKRGYKDRPDLFKGETGPQGPQGPQGPAGAQGDSCTVASNPDGTATITCGQTSATIGVPVSAGPNQINEEFTSYSDPLPSTWDSYQDSPSTTFVNTADSLMFLMNESAAPFSRIAVTSADSVTPAGNGFDFFADNYVATARMTLGFSQVNPGVPSRIRGLFALSGSAVDSPSGLTTALVRGVFLAIDRDTSAGAGDAWNFQLVSRDSAGVVKGFSPMLTIFDANPTLENLELTMTVNATDFGLTLQANGHAPQATGPVPHGLTDAASTFLNPSRLGFALSNGSTPNDASTFAIVDSITLDKNP